MSYLDRLYQNILSTQHEYRFPHKIESHEGVLHVKLEDGTFLFLSPYWEGYRGLRIYHSKTLDTVGFDRRVLEGYGFDLDGRITFDTDLFFDIVSPFLKMGIRYISQ